jgi:hypothetical protein
VLYAKSGRQAAGYCADLHVTNLPGRESRG